MVVTGGYTKQFHHLEHNSTELWIVGSSRGISGPTLPTSVLEGTGITTSDGKSFLLLGGKPSEFYIADDLNTIYKLDCLQRQCDWTLMEQKLRIPRVNPVAIPIPDNLVSCVGRI